jgi:hypothetical protein
MYSQIGEGEGEPLTAARKGVRFSSQFSEKSMTLS